MSHDSSPPSLPLRRSSPHPTPPSVVSSTAGLTLCTADQSVFSAQGYVHAFLLPPSTQACCSLPRAHLRFDCAPSPSLHAQEKQPIHPLTLTHASSKKATINVAKTETTTSFALSLFTSHPLHNSPPSFPNTLCRTRVVACSLCSPVLLTFLSFMCLFCEITLYPTTWDQRSQRGAEYCCLSHHDLTKANPKHTHTPTLTHTHTHTHTHWLDATTNPQRTTFK